MFKSMAPGKLIIVGEYAVLEGAPSISMAVNRYATISLKKSSTRCFNLKISTAGGFSYPFFLVDDFKLKYDASVTEKAIHNLRYFTQAFEASIKYLKSKNIIIEPLDIFLDTRDFYNKNNSIKLGIGSSAALMVATFGGVISYVMNENSPGIPDRKLFEETSVLHKTVQGKIGSAIDIASSVYGGLISYKLLKITDPCSAIINPLNWPKNLFILPVWTMKQASTIELVKKVYEASNKDPAGYQEITSELSEISTNSCSTLINNKISEFLETIRDYGRVLVKLGRFSDISIMSAQHQQIADLVNRSDSSVYKPSGAGGGDFGIIYSASLEELGILKKSITDIGYSIVGGTSISEKGFHIHY